MLKYRLSPDPNLIPSHSIRTTCNLCEAGKYTETTEQAACQVCLAGEFTGHAWQSPAASFNSKPSPSPDLSSSPLPYLDPKPNRSLIPACIQVCLILQPHAMSALKGPIRMLPPLSVPTALRGTTQRPTPQRPATNARQACVHMSIRMNIPPGANPEWDHDPADMQ